jgi:hypothetical protein
MAFGAYVYDKLGRLFDQTIELIAFIISFLEWRRRYFVLKGSKLFFGKVAKSMNE